MQRQQAVYRAISILIAGACCFDLIWKFSDARNHPYFEINVTDTALEIWLIAVGVLTLFTMFMKALTIIYLIEELIRGLDTFGIGPFKFALVTYGFHISLVLLIGIKNPMFQPFLDFGILGTAYSWPYHLASNILVFALTYMGWCLRIDLAWEKFCDFFCGTKNYKPLFKREKQIL